MCVRAFFLALFACVGLGRRLSLHSVGSETASLLYRVGGQASPSKSSNARLARQRLDLWLDLRGKPHTSALAVMRTLHKDVQTLCADTGLVPPVGAAINGLLLSEPLAGEEGDLKDSDVSVFIQKDDCLWHDGQRVGVILDGLAENLKASRAIALAAIRRPEKNLALVGDDLAALQALFEFAFAQAQHCRQISGAETSIFCQVASKEALSAVRRLVRDDISGVPVVAVLPHDADFWLEALVTSES